MTNVGFGNDREEELPKLISGVMHESVDGTEMCHKV